MRLGLIGTGKQGQRYLQEKNGGRRIVVSGSRRIPLDGVDGVIIATHPAGHKELALEAIAAGKAVLIEKPLALNLRDCMEILDAAAAARVPVEVAHTHLWSEHWNPSFWFSRGGKAFGSACYQKHDRDYSAWLDWAPHLFALTADAQDHGALRVFDVAVNRGPFTSLQLMNEAGVGYMAGDEPAHVATPMRKMVEQFRLFSHKRHPGYWSQRIDFNRRVYRALFAEE